jgi:hypothetical protein
MKAKRLDGQPLAFITAYLEAVAEMLFVAA